MQGFALRTTPLGTFTFYFQHLNKATGKRDWHKIGDHPKWSVEEARNEARGLAGLVAKGHDIKQIRNSRVERNRVSGITFRQLHDEYIADCQVLVKRRYGIVPRLESWQEVQSALKRPLERWAKKLIVDITDNDVMELLGSWIDDGHIPMANRVRTLLHTLFVWAARPPRKYITVNPCSNLPPKEDEGTDEDDGRVLDAEQNSAPSGTASMIRTVPATVSARWR